MAASPAVPVSALMLVRAAVLACGLAHREPAMPAGRPCPDCAVASRTTESVDSVRAAAVQRARSATRDGDWNDAADRWRDALLLDGRSGADWIAMGDVLLQAERHREAAAAYERAIQIDARLTERATRGVARAYARLGDDRQAVRWLEQALRLGARPAEALLAPQLRRYRDAPRLQGELRRQIDRQGAGYRERESAET